MSQKESLFTKLFYAGVGIGAITVEKLEKSISQLISKSNKPVNELKEHIDNIVKDLTVKKDDLQQELEKYLKKIAENLKFAKQSDIEEITKRIEQLEKLVEQKLNQNEK